LLVLLFSPAAFAHRPSDSTLTLRATTAGGEGRWDIAIRDLDDTLGVDGDGDGRITWGELRARVDEIAQYALARLALATPAGACQPRSDELQIVRHSDGAYVALDLHLRCPVGAPALTVGYRLFFERDPLHRGIVRVVAGAGEETAVFAAETGPRRFPFAAGAAPAERAPGSFGGFVVEGVSHIWQGLDHVLFLLALLLPAVLRREAGRWIAAQALRPVLADVARVVTAFTLAHSLTLSLAALGLVRVPARLVEPAIAASVALAAANNLRPLFGRDRWAVAFALGLLHGFGFSSVLADVGLPRQQLLAALFGFNLGVELGQLALVAAFVPLAFLVRRTAGYRRLALVGGSAAIAALALVWVLERALDIRVLS
jgi:hypothetical protein